jgi:hypothetical protein
MGDAANRKPLTTVQKVGKLFFIAGGAVFLVGIFPYFLVLLLMATHIMDPTANPVGIGIVFLLSCPVFVALMLIGVFCRFLVSD